MICLFYTPVNSDANQTISTLIYNIPPKNSFSTIQTAPFNTQGIMVVVFNFLSIISIVSVCCYY